MGSGSSGGADASSGSGEAGPPRLDSSADNSTGPVATGGSNTGGLDSGGAGVGGIEGPGGGAGLGGSTGPGGSVGGDRGGTGGSGGSGGRSSGGGPGSGGLVDGGGPSDGSASSDAAAVTEAGRDPGGPFTCTLLVGPSTMAQWFNGGFLMYAGIDATKYELLMVAHHYSDAWAVPGDSAWNTQAAHPCAQGSTTPDRVSFMVTQWTEKLESQWVADLIGIVKNIQTKWPMVKRIEIMPSTSAPGDVPCPGTSGTETTIPAAGYAAIDSMPARYPGLVVALPHFEVTKCSDFIGNGSAPQYAPDANATSGPAVMDIVGVFGAYYAAHP